MDSWETCNRKSRCLPEVTQWFYGFSLRLSWAVVHLVHLFSPSTTRQIWERMSCATPEKSVLFLLSDSNSINTLSFPGNRLRISMGFLPLYHSMALDWFRSWKVITGCYTLWILPLYLCFSSLSLSHCGPSSFSDKTSWLCVSAALTGKASQLRIRRHGARRLIGLGCCVHSCSLIQGATPPPLPKFTQAHTGSCILLGGKRTPWCRF